MYIGDPNRTITFHICALNMMSVKVSWQNSVTNMT